MYIKTGIYTRGVNLRGGFSVLRVQLARGRSVFLPEKAALNVSFHRMVDGLNVLIFLKTVEKCLNLLLL